MPKGMGCGKKGAGKKSTMKKKSMGKGPSAGMGKKSKVTKGLSMMKKPGMRKKM